MLCSRMRQMQAHIDDSGFLPGRMKLASAGGRLNTSCWPGVEKSVGQGTAQVTVVGVQNHMGMHMGSRTPNLAHQTSRLTAG